MSNLKQQLIRLGSINPELRKDLRPILDYLKKSRRGIQASLWEDRWDEALEEVKEIKSGKEYRISHFNAGKMKITVKSGNQYYVEFGRYTDGHANVEVRSGDIKIKDITSKARSPEVRYAVKLVEAFKEAKREGYPNLEPEFDKGYVVNYKIYWSGDTKGTDVIDKDVYYETLDEVIDDYARKRSWFDAGGSKKQGYFGILGKEILSGRTRKEYGLTVKRADGERMSMEGLNYLASAFNPNYF